MKIHIIEPKTPSAGQGSQYFNGLIGPILAAWSVRQGWEAKVSFPQPGQVDYYYDCDVVALRLYTHLAMEGYLIATQFREMGKIVIIGGPHAKGCTEEMLAHADLVFNHCDEEAWRATLQRIENGEIHPGSIPGRVVPSAELRELPPYEEIKPFCGRPVIPMLLSSLGCPHDCDFCADWDNHYFKRNVDDVIKDIKALDKNYFFFADANFGANRKFTSELLEKMIPLKKKYIMQTSLAWLKDEKYLQLLQKSGCIGIGIGLESLSTIYKKNAVKNHESIIEEIIIQISQIKKYIPGVQVNIVLGLDDDTKETFDMVAELYDRAKIDLLAPFISTPFPGTPFFEKVKSHNRIFEKEWKYFNTSDITYELKNFDLGEFLDLIKDLHKKTHSPCMIMKKTISQFKQSKSIVNAFILFVALTNRLFNLYAYTFRDYRRSKIRVRARERLREKKQSLL